MARLGIELLTVTFALALVFTGVSSQENADVLYERARYYIRELGKTLQELESSPNARIHKRSADIPKSCEDLVEYVKQKCPSSKNIPESIATSLDFYEDSPLPSIMLSKLTGKRVGQNLEVQLEIIHSSKIVIGRHHDSDIDTQVRETRTESLMNHGDVELTYCYATVSYDLSLCDHRDPVLHIGPADSDKADEGLRVELDVCDLKDELTGEGDTVVAIPDIPMFKITPEPGDVITIEPGKDVSIDVEFRLNLVSEYKFDSLLWDWENRDRVDGRIRVELNRDGTLDYDKEDGVLSLEILEEEDLYPDEDSIQAYKKDVMVRLTIKTGSGQLSGYLMLLHDYEAKHLEREKRALLDEMIGTRIISLKLPYKISQFPRNALISGPEIGVSRYDAEASCYAYCDAFGSDIKSIFMIKVGMYKPPIDSRTQIIAGQRASVGQTVEPPLPDATDTYRCIVVFQNGHIKWEDRQVSEESLGRYY